MDLQKFCNSIQYSNLGQSIDGSPLWWPIIESTHLVAMVILVGSISVFDARLLGWALKDLRVSSLAERILPATWGAFAVMILTGSLLFISEAETKYCFNNALRIKLVLMLLAGINMSVFHFTIYRNLSHWDTDEVPPLWARMVGSFSVLLWAIFQCWTVRAQAGTRHSRHRSPRHR